MIIDINMTYSEFVNRFERDVTYCSKPPFYLKYLVINEDMIGCINGDKFWIQKTRAHFIASRYSMMFIGKLQVEEPGIRITGRFDYAHVAFAERAACVGAFFAVGLLLILVHGGFFEFVKLATTILVVVAVYNFTVYKIVKKVFEKDNQAVIDYLESLQTE